MHQSSVKGNSYEFFDISKGTSNWEFTKQEREKRQHKIEDVQRELFQVAKQHLCTSISDQFYVPPYLSHNTERWVNLFLRQKHIQGVFLDFHARLY